MSPADIELAEAFAELRAQRVTLEMLGMGEGVAQREPESLPALLAHGYRELAVSLRPENVIEIGAHEGYFSGRMRHHLPQACVLAFEANPEVYARHHRRLQRAGVDYRHQAISDAPGRVRLSVPSRKGALVQTMGSLVGLQGQDESGAVHEVEAITLDSLGKGGAALWIDVEGANAQILDGGEQTLRSALCVQIEVETEQRWPGQATDRTVIQRLAAFGLLPVARDIQRPWQYNAVFVRRELIHDARVVRFRQLYFARLREAWARRLLAPGPAAAEAVTPPDKA